MLCYVKYVKLNNTCYEPNVIKVIRGFGIMHEAQNILYCQFIIYFHGANYSFKHL